MVLTVFLLVILIVVLSFTLRLWVWTSLVVLSLGSSKRASESPAESASKRTKLEKKRDKKKRDKEKRRLLESTPESEASDDPAPDSRLQISVLKTKAGAICELGDVRSVPCYECVRSVTNDSFAKYPNRCFDVKHETRIRMNSQCSTCARKHVSPCNPVCFVVRFGLVSC